MTDTQTDTRKPLTFESDAGATRSRWIAGGLAVAIVAWMGSGFLLPTKNDAAEAPQTASQQPVSVAVKPSKAEGVTQIFVAEGQALPDRDTMIRAETSGRIAEVLVRKGADLAADEVIARFDTAARQADLARAEEELRRAQREFDNAQALLDRGVATVDRVSQARTGLATARAGLTAAEEAINDTVIRAPFDGRLEALEIDEGEFVSTGAEVGRLVDNTPLTIRIQIPQQSLSAIKVGQKAQVDFITGTSAEGVVDFVGSSANAETRTFSAEIAVPNEDGTIPAGISAQVRIPTGETRAHFVSPAILSLDTDGTLGVKTVTEDNRVAFHEISIVRAQTDGIWITGLPEEAPIISIGQGFVNDGEIVDPQIAAATATADQAEPVAGAAAKPEATQGGDTGIIASPQAQAEPQTNTIEALQ
jgi:membrane fusion protein, multidrug efflux system